MRNWRTSFLLTGLLFLSVFLTSWKSKAADGGTLTLSVSTDSTYEIKSDHAQFGATSVDMPGTANGWTTSLDVRSLSRGSYTLTVTDDFDEIGTASTTDATF